MGAIVNSTILVNLLSEDVVGGLLPLLSRTDIRNLRLACRAFATAVLHQLRHLEPLHLPNHPSGPWQSLERLQLNIIRCSTPTDSVDCVDVCAFTSLTPIRSLSGIVWLSHAAHVDLSGQHMGADAMPLLNRTLTRLKSLSMNACRLPMASFASISGLTTLTGLNLSGIQLTGPSQALVAAPGAPQLDAPHEAGPLLDAICQLQKLQQLRLDSATNPKGNHRRSFHGIPVRHQLSKLTALKQLRVLSLGKNLITLDDWEVLCSTIGPQLEELQLTWGLPRFKQPSLVSPHAISYGAFEQIGNLTSLQTLGLDIGLCRESAQTLTLAPVANTLTSLTLSGHMTWQLILSVAACRGLRRLRLMDTASTAGLQFAELLQQVISSLPMLESLQLRNVQTAWNVEEGHQQLQPVGDSLLLQLANCCPHLTQLHMSDSAINGTGLRLIAATLSDTLAESPAAETSVSGAAAAWGAGGLQSCKHLRLYVRQMMRSAFPHLSALTGLRSLSLFGMLQQEFAQLCKLKCLESLSGLANVTSLQILPILDELEWQQRRLGRQYGDPESDVRDDAGRAVLEAAAGWTARATHNSRVNTSSGDAHHAQHNGPGQEAQQQQQQQQQPQQAAGDNIDDPAAALAEVQAAHQDLLHQMLNLIDTLQQQAAILAAHPDPQAGNAFAELVHMLLVPHLDQVAHHQPGAAVVQAAVQELLAVAAQLAEGGAPVQPGHDPHVQAALDAAQQQQQHQQHHAQQQQQQPGPYPGMVGLPQHPFEPHLHFLSKMTGLVNLELNCLHAAGPCLLHLISLTNLRSLALGGSIAMSADLWGALAQLRLPGVTGLSFTGCYLAPAAAGGGGTRGDSNSSSAGAHEQSEVEQAGPSSSSGRNLSDISSRNQTVHAAMCGWVESLCASFPGVVALELGSCRFLTAARLIDLVKNMRHLARLRLLGVPGLQLYTESQQQILDFRKWVATCTAAAAAASGSTPATEGYILGEGFHAAVARMWELVISGYTIPGRSLVATCGAVQNLNSLAEVGGAAVDLKYVEICQSEVPRGVYAAVDGRSQHERVVEEDGPSSSSVSFIKHEGKLKGYVHGMPR